METENEIRRAVVAGIFYSGTQKQLQREVGDLLREAAAPPVAGTLIALIVPHAGYMYSGATAAKAYALVQGRMIDTCVLVGPSHQEYFQGISVFPGSAYETPLGPIDIDSELRAVLLAGSSVVHASMQGHRGEHSLEVQLPFLQSLLPKVKILPLVMGDQRADHCFALGSALAAAAEHRNVLLVASSDLSHFHSSDEARRKDANVIALIEQFNIRELMTQLETESCEACGGGPIVAVMTAAHHLGATSASIVHACNSGDVTGDTGRVVGYCSAALWKNT
jgi:MEMO1 family protein